MEVEKKRISKLEAMADENHEMEVRMVKKKMREMRENEKQETKLQS